MKNATAVMQHYIGNVLFFLYVVKEEIKIKAIRIFRGKEAEKKYVLSRVKIPISFYMHQAMMTLGKILNVDHQGWVLYLDMHDVGIGRMQVPEVRVITSGYFGEFHEELSKSEQRAITLKYLLRTGDITQRQIDFKRYYVDQWLKGIEETKHEHT